MVRHDRVQYREKERKHMLFKTTLTCLELKTNQLMGIINIILIEILELRDIAKVGSWSVFYMSLTYEENVTDDGKYL